MESLDAAREALDRDGVCRWPEALPEAVVAELEDRLGAGSPLERRPIGLDALQNWLAGTFLPDRVAGILGPDARPVRALLMGKAADRENWAIAWHQDSTLALKEPREVPGFGPWVNKAHFYHAQAPASVMEGMLATRLHLDPCGEGQGPLKVLPGSHLGGRLGDAEIEAWRARVEPRTILASRGDVVFMKPLVLHGSDRATDPSPRRVLHVEWASAPLPGGLAWAWF
ncbi:MAG: phytanoyl-CoA dioxygenase family protein [Holophagaceae bacterium]